MGESGLLCIACSITILEPGQCFFIRPSAHYDEIGPELVLEPGTYC